MHKTKFVISSEYVREVSSKSWHSSLIGSKERDKVFEKDKGLHVGIQSCVDDSNADLAGCVDDRKRTRSYIFILIS